jgi:hypothetical protein
VRSCSTSYSSFMIFSCARASDYSMAAPFSFSVKLLGCNVLADSKIRLTLPRSLTRPAAAQVC